MRRFIVPLLIAVMVVSIILAGCVPGAPEEEVVTPPTEEAVTLDWTSYISPKTRIAEGTEKWFDDLEDATGGLVKSEYHWAGAMGVPTDHYDLARTGVADTAIHCNMYTPGTFPMLEIFDALPITGCTNEQAAMALTRMWEKGYFDEELADIKYLGSETIAYQMFFVDERIDTVAGFDGKKIRCPSPGVIEWLESMGVVSVSVPVPDIYGALSKGIVDGTAWPWNAVLPYKVEEVTKYCLETSTFYAVYSWYMNKDTWESLPETAKEWLDDNWPVYINKIAAAVDARDAEGREGFIAVGGEAYDLAPGEREKLDMLLAPMVENWIAEKETLGFPAREAVDDLYEILTDLDVEEPIIGYQR